MWGLWGRSQWSALYSPHRAISEMDFIHRRSICKPASLTILESTPSYSKAQVRISEENTTKEKMFLATVKVSLKRLSFGPFTLIATWRKPTFKWGRAHMGQRFPLKKRDKLNHKIHCAVRALFIRSFFYFSHSKNQDHKTRHKCSYSPVS